LDIPQDSEFASGWRYPKTVLRRETDKESGNGSLFHIAQPTSRSTIKVIA